LDFTARRVVTGHGGPAESRIFSLIPGCIDVEVGSDNFFFGINSEPLLAVFDVQELELLMYTLPEIGIADWQANAEYTGKYEDDGALQYHWV
jgi:hypothetical protein